MNWLKRVVSFVKGDTQFAPRPYWIWPQYIGDGKKHHAFKWFFITINTPNSKPGDTLFIYWKRQRSN